MQAPMPNARPIADELATIVAAASFVHERLALAGAPGDDATIEARLARWCELAAGGDRAAFASRLAWDGVELATIRAVLGEMRASGALPGWAETIPDSDGLKRSRSTRPLATTSRGDYSPRRSLARRPRSPERPSSRLAARP